jgi:1-acyl-sn-glycerol-3-phosphate acyltransferase
MLNKTADPPNRWVREDGRTVAQHLGYDAFRVVARLVGITFFGLRTAGRENYPTTGGGLICANHQSYFDPVLVGLTCDRRLNYLARESLFKVPVLKQAIKFLDAIPIDRDGSGISGLKETLRRLKRGEFVLIFPEGTRSRDGDVNRLKPGFCAVARRSKVPLVPVGFDGAYQAWPRSAKLPRFSQAAVVIGEPIQPSEVESLDDRQLVAELERRIRECHSEARQLRLASRAQ